MLQVADYTHSHPAWVAGYQCLFEHVAIEKDKDDLVVHMAPSRYVMQVTHEGSDLYGLWLKQVGKDISEHEAASKVREGATAYALQEEDEGLRVTGTGLSQPLLFKDVLTPKLREGEWIVELTLQKFKNTDYILPLKGVLVDACFNTEQRVKARNPGFAQRHDRHSEQVPKPRKGTETASKSKADILKPKRGDDHISKTKTKSKAKGKPHGTVTSLAQSLGKTMSVNRATLDYIEESTEPAGTQVDSRPGWFGHLATFGRGLLGGGTMTGKDASPTTGHESRLSAKSGSYDGGAADDGREGGSKRRLSRQ